MKGYLTGRIVSRTGLISMRYKVAQGVVIPRAPMDIDKIVKKK